MLDVLLSGAAENDDVINDFPKPSHTLKSLIHPAVVMLSDRGYPVWGPKESEPAEGRDERCQRLALCGQWTLVITLEGVKHREPLSISSMDRCHLLDGLGDWYSSWRTYLLSGKGRHINAHQRHLSWGRPQSEHTTQWVQ